MHFFNFLYLYHMIETSGHLEETRLPRVASIWTRDRQESRWLRSNSSWVFYKKKYMRFFKHFPFCNLKWFFADLAGLCSISIFVSFPNQCLYFSHPCPGLGFRDAFVNFSLVRVTTVNNALSRYKFHTLHMQHGLVGRSTFYTFRIQGETQMVYFLEFAQYSETLFAVNSTFYRTKPIDRDRYAYVLHQYFYGTSPRSKVFVRCLHIFGQEGFIICRTREGS